MATESVKILIEAEDQASAKIAAASNEVENRIKNIKDVGGKAKASTEFIGTLAGALGGSEIAVFASQLGGLTEKVGAFSEVQKAGGAGAFAFKAGLVGVAGVIGFQVGNALGNVIFQTEKWTEALKTANEESKRLESVASGLRTERFQDARADIELIRDPEQKRAEYQKLLDDLKTNIVGVEGQVRSSKKAVEEWDAAWQITGDRKGFAEQSKLQLEQDKERLKQLQEQQKEIQKLITIEAEREEIRKRNAAQDADEKYLETLDKQLAKLRAVKENSSIILEVNTRQLEDMPFRDSLEPIKINVEGLGEIERVRMEIAALEDQTVTLASIREEARQSIAGLDVGIGDEAAREAEAKLTQIRLIEKQNELEKLQADEKKQRLKEVADAESANAKRIADLLKQEEQRLEEQKILLNQGAEAANAFRLAKQGLSQEQAKEFASQQAAIDEEKKIQEKMKRLANDTAQPLQAFTSRLLTRGGSDDPAKMTEQNTANAVKELRALNKQMMADRKNNTTLKVLTA